ncbi:hypothetical protein GQ54DRAFT_33178 [Martensiomyces pterosporus]|nr:hypothetical protein GQ54DRAFT_33178 [Martensiomyces pterosporus]
MIIVVSNLHQLLLHGKQWGAQDAGHVQQSGTPHCLSFSFAQNKQICAGTLPARDAPLAPDGYGGRQVRSKCVHRAPAKQGGTINYSCGLRGSLPPVCTTPAVSAGCFVMWDRPDRGCSGVVTHWLSLQTIAVFSAAHSFEARAYPALCPRFAGTEVGLLGMCAAPQFGSYLVPISDGCRSKKCSMLMVSIE